MYLLLCFSLSAASDSSRVRLQIGDFGDDGEDVEDNAAAAAGVGAAAELKELMRSEDEPIVIRRKKEEPN